MGLRIEINRERCMASGNCMLWAPGVFDQDDEGIAIVADPTGEPDDAIQTAAANCPVNAITVTDS